MRLLHKGMLSNPLAQPYELLWICRSTSGFLASLADRVGMNETTIASDGVSTARDVWVACVSNIEIPGNAKVAINQQYADFDTHSE